MAKRKTGSRKKSRKKTGSRSKVSLGRQVFKAVVGLTILVAIVIGSGLLLHFTVRPKSSSEVASSGRRPAAKTKPHPKSSPQVYNKKTVSPSKPARRPKGNPPLLAIIIDDIGRDREQAEKFINLEQALTLSILPYNEHGEEIARKAHRRGCEIMLHQPMEPTEYPQVNPGRGALLTSMKPDELIGQLERNIDAIPHVKGINNHMGSKLTASSEQMYQMFSILKKRGLYFVDSRTTDDSLCRPSARLFQVPFGARDIFIDNIQTHQEIRRQLDKLVLIADNHGRAIGIGHPYQATYEVLKAMLPELKKKVRLLPVSKLVRFVG